MEKYDLIDLQEIASSADSFPRCEPFLRSLENILIPKHQVFTADAG
jgi:hypothetical protein